MADKNKLRQMLDNMIDGQTEQARTQFHQYLQSVMKDRVKNNQSSDQNSN